jgi:hypothetical protein
MTGVHRARVTDAADPEGVGRVRIRLVAKDGPGGRAEMWAPTVRAAGAPAVGDEVLVAFEAGDPRRPYVIGARWSGTGSPAGDADAVTVRVETGSVPARIVLATPDGDAATITVAPHEIELSTPDGNAVRIGPAGIDVTAPGRIRVSATRAEITAGAVTVDAGMSTFSGVLKADTVITNAVVSGSYTPGEGNIW